TMVRALALLAALAAVAPAGPAAAAPERIEFTVRPAAARTDDPRTNAWLVHRARPGSTIRTKVVVANLGTVPLDLLLYPADAFSTDQGEFGLEPVEDADDGVAGWISVEHSEISLDPDEAREVRVVIRVPESATPGDHPGAVVARTARPIRQGDVPTLLAVGTRVYTTVPGPRVDRVVMHGIDAVVQDGRPRFELDLENTGNTMVEITGSYALRGLFGLDTGEGTIERPITLVPGARAHPVVVHPDPVLGGSYRAEFDLAYGDGRRLRGTVEFSAGFAWPLVALIAVAVAALTALVTWGRRSRRRSPKPTANGQRAFDALRRPERARTSR
ncbi:MAG TPA: hypothetical protein VHL78_13655, partial [Actinomycetota bacterium]|nr:hypothetical protein [Actinomycetota bacterium]